MTPIRVLAVDDEKPARERLRRLLDEDARVALFGCCGSGKEALETARAAADAGTPVHLVFLDVQMPDVDGLAVASALREQPDPVVIVFVTAHDEYALRAFDARALDYLLKPFSDERFQAALDRAIGQVKASQAHNIMSRMQTFLDGSTSGERASPAKRPLDRIVLKGLHRVRLLPVEQISWIEADGMYVKLHTRDGGVHLHRGLLGSLDESLDPQRFIRIHRSAIVNIDLVSELRQDVHGDYVALLRDSTEVRVGRRFRARLQERLGQPL